MASFEREEGLVRLLLDRLGQVDAKTSNPNAGGTEAGVDVATHLSGGKTIGIQVTEIDPFNVPGTARAQEKARAATSEGTLYGMWAQNNPSVVLDAISRSVERKVQIAEGHSFNGYNEVWLLICAGIPEHGATASTFIHTQNILAEDLNVATDHSLKTSKYNQCFLLSILGSEQAFYRWNKNSNWKKEVGLEDISERPNEEYVRRLKEAKSSGNQQEFERLADEEAQRTLDDVRRSDTDQI